VQSVTTDCFINPPSFSDTDYRRHILGECNREEPSPAAARSKAWVCGHSLAGIGGSIPAGSMDACLLRVLFVIRYRSLRRADHSSRRLLPSVVCLNVILKPRK